MRNYSEAKNLLLEVINVASDAIMEMEAKKPNHTTICDLAIEKMDELNESISVAILGKMEHSGFRESKF